MILHLRLLFEELYSTIIVSALLRLTWVEFVQVNAVNDHCPVSIARAVWSLSMLKTRDQNL